MKAIVRRRDRARQDLIAIYRHLAREAGVRTASRFLVHAEKTFERLAGMPQIGTRYEAENPAFAEVRYFPISRFNTWFSTYRRRAAWTSFGFFTVRVTATAS